MNFDTISELLSHPTRRYTLYYLDGFTEERTIDVCEIADFVETTYQQFSSHPPPDTDSMEIELRHNHLPQLAESDLVAQQLDQNQVVVHEFPLLFSITLQLYQFVEFRIAPRIGR